MRIVAIAAALLVVGGCHKTCEERCAGTQERCFGVSGEPHASLCASQCKLAACGDCFRCLDDEQACGSDDVCQQRCLGCSRVQPP